MFIVNMILTFRAEEYEGIDSEIGFSELNFPFH